MALQPLAEWNLSKETGWPLLSSTVYSVDAVSSTVWGIAVEMIKKADGVHFGERRIFRLDFTNGIFSWFPAAGEYATHKGVDEAGNSYWVHKEEQQFCKVSTAGDVLFSVPLSPSFATFAASDRFGVTLWEREPRGGTLTHFNSAGEKQWEISTMEQIYHCDIAHLADRIALLLKSSVVTYMELTEKGAYIWHSAIAACDAVPDPLVSGPEEPIRIMMSGTGVHMLPSPSLQSSMVLSYRHASSRKSENDYLLRPQYRGQTRAFPCPQDFYHLAVTGRDSMLGKRTVAGERYLVLVPAPDWSRQKTARRYFARRRRMEGNGDVFVTG